MFVIKCPHCYGERFIEQLNCGIFRDGVFKQSLEPIPPHSTREECEKLLRDNVVIGCTRPFQIIVINDKYVVQKCDYI